MNSFPASMCGLKTRLAIECGMLYVGVPVAYIAGWLPLTILPLLFVMSVGCWWVLRRQHTMSLQDLIRKEATWLEWRRILIHYAVAIPCLVCLLSLTNLAALFSLIIQHPKIWVLVIMAYPIISVLPQELIYRVYFFERYRPLFGRGFGMIAANAVAFSIGHIVFRNWPAVVLTLLGGLLFAKTYERTLSLRLVAVEHALYGCAVFTIGYGSYFYEGTLRLFR